MCIKCERYFKRYGTKNITYGQAKAIAHNIMSQSPFWKIRKLFAEKCDNIAIEYHLWKFLRARTKKRYDRKRGKNVRDF